MILLALLAVGGAGCGAETVHGDPDSTPPTLPSDVPPPASGCPGPLVVPGGKTWHVQAVLAEASGSWFAPVCGLGTPTMGEDYVQQFLVEAFFLDEHAVTNRCYQACVDDGACQPPEGGSYAELGIDWDAPDLGDAPVSVSDEQGVTYCEWRRGRLPTAVELERADRGDLLALSNELLMWETVACRLEDKSSSRCELLLQYGHPLFALSLPIGAVSEDSGAYGHQGLFGGARELTGTVLAPGNGEVLCSLEPGVVAPPTFGVDGDGTARYAPALTATSVAVATGNEPFYLSSFVHVTAGAAPSEGIRCAYDAE